MSENTCYLWNQKLSYHTIWKAETVQSSDHGNVRRSTNFISIHKSNIWHFKSKHAVLSHLTHAQSSYFKYNIPYTLFCFLPFWVQPFFFFFGHWIISTLASFLNFCARNYSTFSEVQKKTEFYRIFGPTFQVLLLVDLPLVIPTHIYSQQKKKRKRKNYFP